MKTYPRCTECYGDPDLYYGCDDCGRPPRHHLMTPDHQLSRHAQEIREGREPVAPAPGVSVSIVAVTFGDGTSTIAWS